MTQIQNSIRLNSLQAKQMSHLELFQMASLRVVNCLCSNRASLHPMFGSLDIDPPEAEIFIWNLVLGIWDFN